MAHMTSMVVSTVGQMELDSSPNGKQNRVYPSPAAKKAGFKATLNVEEAFSSGMTTGNNLSNLKACADVWTLNVGGKVFQVRSSTLQKKDQGVLSRLSPSHDSFQESCNQYFFDRNPKYFTAILDYYRTGKMHVSRDFCGSQLEEELAYWQLTDDVIGECCWRRYSDLREEVRKNAQVTKEYLDICQVRLSRLMGLPLWKERMWVTLDDPLYSLPARVVLFTYLFLVLVSFTTACSLSFSVSLHRRLNLSNESKNNSAETGMFNIKTSYDKDFIRISLHYVELGCLCVLSFFFGVRAVICPDKGQFWRSPLNILDALYIISSGLSTFLCLQFSATFVIGLNNYMIAYAIHHFTMIIGVLRVFRAARHYRGVRELWYAIRASFREVWLLSMFVTIGVVIFGILFYCADLLYDDQVDNVFVGFWWALITMTTVGYGDVVPRQLIGYMVAAVCAMVGLVVISLPIPFIAHNFSLYYGYRSRTCKLVTAMKHDIQK
ncbi:potassium voltage-gated channel subfamily C member 3-like [Liolophura sinensis]|uniref:potassium voltage-gated channel subfamily C member 3-like n=1 Tax=Liolophura sinensis TaxID=3198878 RepID=UPI003158E6FA